MRTTIEVTDEQYAKLVHLAARRGLKGFSALVQEALDQHLEAHEERDEAVRLALAARGALKGKEADAVAEACRETRRSWR